MLNGAAAPGPGAGGEGVFFHGATMRLLGAAFLAACASAFAQSPQKPALDDSPRFEIRRFIFDGATLVPRERLEADTQQYIGPGRTFSDVQRALEAVERVYSEAGWSAVQVVLPEQELDRGEIQFQIIQAKLARPLPAGTNRLHAA